MKLYKVEAIVLKSREMREADRVLTLFSWQAGKIRAAAHGVNKPSSRKRGAVQPFCYTSFLLHKGKELDSISQCEEIETFYSLREDLDKISYASYFAELVDAVTVENNTDRDIFALLLKTFYLLCVDGIDEELLARTFEIKLMNISGYRPVLKKCVFCGNSLQGGNKVKFSSISGGVVCQDCFELDRGAKKYPRGTIEVLRVLMDWELGKTDRLKISHGVRKEIKEIMKDYINCYTEKNLKSMQFLEQVQHYRFNKK